MASKAPRNPRIGLLLYVAVVAVLCALCSGADVGFAVQQTPGLQFASMLALVGWFFALVLLGLAIACLGSQWNSLRYWAMIPLLLCLGSCAGTSSLARAARAAQFERRLPRYEALIAKMESGALPVSAEGKSVALPESDRNLAYSVLAQKDTNGGTDGRVPHWRRLSRRAFWLSLQLLGYRPAWVSI